MGTIIGKVDLGYWNVEQTDADRILGLRKDAVDVRVGDKVLCDTTIENRGNRIRTLWGQVLKDEFFGNYLVQFDTIYGHIQRIVAKDKMHLKTHIYK